MLTIPQLKKDSSAFSFFFLSYCQLNTQKTFFEKSLPKTTKQVAVPFLYGHKFDGREDDSSLNIAKTNAECQPCFSG